MATQLTLISVPTTPAAVTPGSNHPSERVGETPGGPGTPGAPAAHRRSVDHTGWLDRRTIATGRRGVARARAALADATRRTAEADSRLVSARDAALARQAVEIAHRTDPHGHAA